MKIKLKTDFKPGDSSETILKKLLKTRHLTNPKEIDHFLNPPEPSLSLLQEKLKIDPHQLELAKKLITKSISAGEDICIYGDYDADGITSTAILWKALISIGAKVLPFIPHRKIHGYGMSKKALDEILSGEAFRDTKLSPFRPSLIITTDNGITANEEINYLKKKKIKVILTDHHQAEDLTPTPDVLVHTTATSAAGIAWVFARYLTGDSDESKKLVDLTAIGIIADQIPLTGINRDIVTLGLKELTATSNVGLQQLYKLSGIKGRHISTYEVNYVIAPRINAMGRLNHALDSLRLLCTKDIETGAQLSELLEETNKTRQDMTYDAVAHIPPDLQDNKISVTASDSYHEGIIGLIAGKITQVSGRPALVISIGKTISKGSARSIPGINIVDILRSNKQYLESVGGHKMAAGFSLKTKNLDKFRIAILKYTDKHITNDQLVKDIEVDGKITLEQASKQLYHLISKMYPFGMGNPRPKFLTSGVNVLDSKLVGSKSQHLKMTIEKSGETKDSIWFNSSKHPDDIKSIVYTIDLNQWNNKQYLQLVIKHAF